MTSTNAEALWCIDTVKKLNKIKVFYPYEQFADGTIRVKPFNEYILLTTQRGDVEKILSTCSVGHVILYCGRQFTKYHILRLLDLKGEQFQAFIAYLRGFHIKYTSALEIKPHQYIDTKYTGLPDKTQKACEKYKRKPYQILLQVLEKRKNDNFITFTKPKNNQVKVALPFPANEGGSRTQKDFVKQFAAIQTPYQFFANLIIPYYLICQTQLLFLKGCSNYRVKVSIRYVKSILPKSRNLTMQNLIKLVNEAAFMTCEKVDKHLIFDFKPEFIENLKSCRIINTDLTFITGGAAFAGNNLGSTPESIKALLLFLSAVQSRKFLKISMRNFLEITGFSAKSRNVVASINRILTYLYQVGVLTYKVEINKEDLKHNSTLKIKLK